MKVAANSAGREISSPLPSLFPAANAVISLPNRVQESFFFIVDETMAGPTGWQLVEKKGDGGCLSVSFPLSLSLLLCHTHPRPSEKMEKFFEVLVFLPAPPHPTCIPGARQSGNKREERRTSDRVRQQEIHSSSLARSLALPLPLGLPHLPKLAPGRGRLLPEFITNRPTDRPTAPPRGVTEGCSLEFRSDNEHRRGERSMRDSPLL